MRNFFKINIKGMRKMVQRWLMLIIAASGVLSALLFTVAYFAGMNVSIGREGFMVAWLSIVASTLIGVVVAIPISKFILTPIQRLSNSADEIAKGNFNVRVDVKKGPREFRELYESFNKMAEQLGETEMFRQDFINDFSHEFKTPIVSIRGFAKQLERDATLSEEKKREYIAIIAEESERLSNMSSNVLLLSRLENQQYITGEVVIDLDEQIRQCILVLERMWENKNIEFDIELEELKDYSNDEMLRQLWINLLSNAIKFTPDKGRIFVGAKREGGYIIVTISDNGCGMDESTLERIFDKFYQGDSSHSTQGNGLGLPLVKRIVQLCEAELTVKSKVGEGTSFIVKLPISSEIYNLTTY